MLLESPPTLPELYIYIQVYLSRLLWSISFDPLPFRPHIVSPILQYPNQYMNLQPLLFVFPFPPPYRPPPLVFNACHPDHRLPFEASLRPIISAQPASQRIQPPPTKCLVGNKIQYSVVAFKSTNSKLLLLYPTFFLSLRWN